MHDIESFLYTEGIFNCVFTLPYLLDVFVHAFRKEGLLYIESCQL